MEGGRRRMSIMDMQWLSEWAIEHYNIVLERRMNVAILERMKEGE